MQCYNNIIMLHIMYNIPYRLLQWTIQAVEATENWWREDKEVRLIDQWHFRVIAPPELQSSTDRHPLDQRRRGW